MSSSSRAQSEAMTPDSENGHFHRALGLPDATALVAGSMIGSGIFIVPAAMVRDLGSPAWLLALLTAANCRGVEVGKTIQNIFTLAKLAALIGLIALCVGGYVPAVVHANFADPWRRDAAAGLPLAAAIGSAIVGALFSADAW